MRTAAALVVLVILIAILLVVPVVAYRTIRAAGPGIRFQRRHRPTALTLPHHQYRVRCSCGWTGPVRDGGLAASGDQQDHVMAAWHAARGD